MKTRKFKGTEIGMIPEDWKLTEFANLLSGKTRNGVYKSKEFHGSGVRIINMKELFSFARIGDQEMKRVRLNDSEKSRFLVEEGDLLFARRSLVAEGSGKCAIIVRHSDPMTFESSMILARPNKKTVDPNFLYYFFLSPKGRYVMGTILRQVAVSGITGTDLMQLKIITPPLPEQYAIAKVLSDLDFKIELLQDQNKTLEAIGQAIFKHWFVDFEFPNEQGKPYKSSGGKLVKSDMGMIPLWWTVKPIDEVAEFLNGLALQKYPAECDHEYLPVIKIRELKQGITESSDKASTDVPKEYVVGDGDILFSWSGSLEVVIWAHGKGALNQHLFKVTSKDYPKWFYYYWTLQHLPEYRQIAEGKATTMGHIQRSHLKASLVLIPGTDVLSRMDAVFRPIIERMITVKIFTRDLVEIRDSLLPKLISGKIRVPVIA